jgi:hypothetical protein
MQKRLQDSLEGGRQDRQEDPSNNRCSAVVNASQVNGFLRQGRLRKSFGSRFCEYPVAKRKGICRLSSTSATG